MRRRQFILGIPAVVMASPEPAPGRWQRRADMPVARSETPAIVNDGFVYVAGGFDAGAAAHRYDPASDQWEQLADLPIALNHPGIASHHNHVIVAGGYAMDGGSAFRRMWAYNENQDEWEPIGELPEPMGAFGLATIQDDLYLVGGAVRSLNGDPSAATWRWLSREGSWEARAPLANPREHLALVAAQGNLYAIGGRVHGSDSSDLGSAVERYDPVADEWTSIQPLPHPRSGLNGTSICGSVIVAGGETSQKVFDVVQILNIADETWQNLPALPIAVHGAAIASLGSVLFAIGGSRAPGRVQSISSVFAMNVQTERSACLV